MTVISFDTAIVGLQHHEGWTFVGKNSYVALVHEKENPYDENAVAVYPIDDENPEDIINEKMGYIPKAIAAVLCSIVPGDVSDFEARTSFETSIKCAMSAQINNERYNNFFPLTVKITCTDTELRKKIQDDIIRVLAQERQRKIDDDFRKSARKVFGDHHTDEQLDKLIDDCMGNKHKN